MKPDLNKCLICQSQTIVDEYPDKNIYKVSCSRCGKYEITDSALNMFNRSNEIEKVLRLSYWIQQNQIKDNYIEINENLIRDKLSIPYTSPKPMEQANTFILWLGNQMKKPDQKIGKKASDLISILGAYDENGVYYIAKYLHDQGFIHDTNLNTNLIRDYYLLNMTFKGWDRYYELQRTNKDSSLAFMAMQFGEEPLTTIYKTVIKDAVEKTGFDIRKLDEEKRAGLIDDKLRVEIRRSKFLIADLTHDNNGAYWEAGFAEGLGIPVIYICEEEKFKNSKSHFDTNHNLTVLWKNDETGLKEFADQLKDTIRATFPNEAKMED